MSRHAQSSPSRHPRVLRSASTDPILNRSVRYEASKLRLQEGIELFSSHCDVGSRGTTKEVQPRRRIAEGTAGLLEVRLCARHVARPRAGHSGVNKPGSYAE